MVSILKLYSYGEHIKIIFSAAHCVEIIKRKQYLSFHLKIPGE